MTARVRLTLALALLLGCSSPEPREPASPDPVPGLGEEVGKPKGPAGGTYRSAKDWTDATEGPLKTLVYMGEAGSKSKKTPHPIIFSSDPNNTYFWRENNLSAVSAARKAKLAAGDVPFEAQESAGRATVTVRRLYREEMKLFLDALGEAGLHGLPWADFGFRERIGPERALYLYTEGTCQRVGKAGLELSALKAFTKVERKIIALSSGR